MSRRYPRLLMAFLVGATLGLVFRACGGDGARPGAEEEAVGAYDSTLAAEVARWRSEAEARRQAWAEARRRLDELDEVRDGVEQMEPDSLGRLAGAVLRRRIG